MGTSWTVETYLPAHLTLAAARHAISACLEVVIDEMSQWVPQAFISRFNAAPVGAWMAAPGHFLRVLSEALRIARATDGAFNPALGRLVDLWGFGPGEPSPLAPSPDVLAALAADAKWRDVVLDGDRVYQSGVTFDFSGIAKGYAVDLVADTLRANGAPSGLVEIGGELRGWGVKEDGAPWWVELEALPGEGGPSGLTLALHERAIATSGDFRRTRHLCGRRISHTLNPATGAPLGTDAPALVSVVHTSCMTADAFATAFGVMGVERSLAFASSHGIAARFVVRRGGHAEERLSPAMAIMLD